MKKLLPIITLSLFPVVCWAFKVPAFQQPDENSHFDYAVSIYSAGRLLRVGGVPSEMNAESIQTGVEWERVSHLYTKYLAQETGFTRIKYHPEEKVPEGYGSLAYFHDLDARAPAVEHSQRRDNPWMLAAYPVGYYGTVALWMRLVSPDRPVELFFAARLFSVLLLAVSLVLSYLVLRRLDVTEGKSLAVVALLAFFPLTTAVSSSVQPDNLCLTLSLLAIYLALKEKPWMTGLVLGLLFITKYHTGAACLCAVLIYLWRKGAGRKALFKVFIPVPLCALIQLYVGLPTENHFRRASVGQWPYNTLLALRDFYFGGDAFRSWFGWFGWADTPLIIRSERVQAVVYFAEIAVTMALFVLVCVALRRRWRSVLDNPLVTYHLLFILGLFFLYVVSDNSFFAQGRHLYPVLLSGFYLTFVYVPESFRRGRLLFYVLCVLTVAYDVVGQYYAYRDMAGRFYGEGRLY
ncbi:MAG TPA: DUF2142 domain-containing protein [Pyrinomonadaceae bacterium]|jgi:hypothetical protein|nr:DUF2142 domain-containing protein [Pyrinomonadaceae bacterium]